MIRLYGNRIVSLHLRQSVGGVWSELLGPEMRGAIPGDIDYVPVLRELVKLQRPLPAMLEICAEEGTKRTLSLQETHRLSLQWLREQLNSVDR